MIEVDLGPDANGQSQMVMVKIVRENLHREKPFLGGFRNKQTAVVYHHASSQTVRKRKSKGVPKAHRETQTCEFATRSQQTNRESGTQMDRKDLYIDHSGDRTLFARRWMPSEELLALRDNKAREVQCFIRQCFAWRRVRRLREARYEEEFKTVQQREEQEAKAQAEHKRQIDRRMHPRTKEDFDILSRRPRRRPSTNARSTGGCTPAQKRTLTSCPRSWRRGGCTRRSASRTAARARRASTSSWRSCWARR